MATTATGPYPPGIYRIVVADGSPFESQRLTYDDNHNSVTVLPAGVDDDSNQEWQIVPGKNPSTIAISRPSEIFPVPYLTYGNSAGPKAGDLIRVQRAPSPLTTWRIINLPISTVLIQADFSVLGITVAPPKIFPPILELNDERQLEWKLELVRPVN